MSGAQLSACVCAGVIVFACMWVCFQMGRADASIRLRSACDVESPDRIHLKPGFYSEVRHAQFR